VEKAKHFEYSDKLAEDYQSRYKARAQNTSIAIFVAAAATALLSIVVANPLVATMPNLSIPEPPTRGFSVAVPYIYSAAW
jgi:hypothetical protein